MKFSVMKYISFSLILFVFSCNSAPKNISEHTSSDSLQSDQKSENPVSEEKMTNSGESLACPEGETAEPGEDEVAISLSEDKRKAFVSRDPEAIGTSGEDFFLFDLICEDGKRARVLEAYGRQFFIMDFLPENGWYPIVFSVNADKSDPDGMPIYRDGFVEFGFVGNAYEQKQENLWWANKDLLIREADKLAQTAKVDTHEEDFASRLVPTTAPELRFSLDNGDYFARELYSNGPEEKQVKAHFIRFYPEANSVVYVLEKYEEVTWLWVELSDGNSFEFSGEPALSPSGKRIAAFGGNIDQPEMKRELVFADLKGGQITLSSTTEIPEENGFILSALQWTSENSLSGIATSLNKENAEVNSPVEIRVR